MVTVKRDTIKTKPFEEKVIKAIKTVKRMELPDKEKDDVLTILRDLHNGCLEWSAPEDPFRILEELR